VSGPTVAEWPFRHPRLTIRTRLTLVYGTLFMIAAVALVVVMYLAVRQRLEPSGGAVVAIKGTVDAKGGLPGIAGPVAKQNFTSDLNAALEAYNAETLNRLMWSSLVALLAIGAAAFSAGWVLAGRVLRPLHEITATARRVAGGRLNERIALAGPEDEFKELADTFDAMLARLDASFAGQRRFAANASHELRTPLAINRTVIEVALADPEASPDLRAVGRSLLATNERSERLIDGLLTLTRSEHELTDVVVLDLAEVARQTLQTAAPEAADRGVQVRTDLGSALVRGDAVLLERLALNLVQNGIRYNAEGGWVEVTTGQRHGSALLVVANSGPVVPATQVETLFQPFRRLGTERVAGEKGMGLGLSIVRSVAAAHHGMVQAEPRPGGGLVVRVTFATVA
jgi:signal transduction histidine kinase